MISIKLIETIFKLIIVFAIIYFGATSINYGQIQPSIRINCGGPRVEYSGIVFEADKYYTGTYKYSNPSIWDIKNTKYDELYFTERAADNDLGLFSYNIPVKNGDYTVAMHFAEIYWDCPGGQPGKIGDRVFSVEIEGDIKLNDFDILAEVGPATAIVKKFDVTVLDDTLTIRFKPTKNRGKISALEVIPAKGGEVPLDVQESSIDKSPDNYLVSQNYPNPFNPTTNIKFTVNNPGNVKLVVFDALGEEVGMLVNEYKNRGNYIATFDASNLNSGIYFYKLELNGLVEIKKMSLVK
ncbi:MAG: malectin domain-containing carbohydrate-binding protein [Ignavibacteriales bacterium]|nr:malectin domain-containing carbohydrate-binding protein [Ignavibacteriales bacterium]